jgi:hypothetical protein
MDTKYRNGSTENNTTSDTNDLSECVTVEILDDLLIKQVENKIKALVELTFLYFRSNYNDLEYLKHRAILARTNEIVDEINKYMLNLVPKHRIVQWNKINSNKSWTKRCSGDNYNRNTYRIKSLHT